MWNKFFELLKDRGVNKEDCRPFKDEKTQAILFFIPWQAASKLDVAKLTPVLPSGWYIQQKTREKDIKEANTLGVLPSPSIKVAKGTDMDTFLSENS